MILIPHVSVFLLELCSGRETHAAGTILAKGIQNLSLQEPSTCNNHSSTIDTTAAVSGVIGTGNSNACYAYAEHSVPVVVSYFGGGSQSNPSLVNMSPADCGGAGGADGSGNIESNAISISTAASSSSSIPVQCVSECVYKPSTFECDVVERAASLVGATDAESIPRVGSASTAIVNSPSLLPLQTIACEETARQAYRRTNRQSMCDSSCSTTPSLALPPSSSVLMCTMMPYSVLNSGDSCCSSVTTMSSCCSFEEHHLHFHYPDDSTASSSAADTPTNCCSQELAQTQICTKSVLPKKGTYDDASPNLLLLDARHYAASSSSTSPCSSLTSSKSENNIFDGNFATFSSIYDVVSMDSVTDAANMTAPELSVMLPFHGCAITDLSRPPPPPPAAAALHDVVNVGEIVPGRWRVEKK